MNKVFLFFVFSVCAVAATSDFEDVCLKKPPVKDFTVLVESILNDHTPLKKALDVVDCKKFEKSALEAKNISIREPIEDLSLFRFFPNADSIWLVLTSKNKILNFGEHPMLETIFLHGDVNIKSLGSVLKSPKLSYLTIGTKEGAKTGFADIKGLGELKQIKKLLFMNISIKNSSEIEKLKNLEFVDIIKGAKLDSKIDMKLLPNLKSVTVD